MLLEIKNLKASVEGKEILKGINLSINAGEVHAIMGPNGSGKSTLVRTILGLEEPEGGTIAIFGTPRPAFRQWRRIGSAKQAYPVGHSHCQRRLNPRPSPGKP